MFIIYLPFLSEGVVTPPETPSAGLTYYSYTSFPSNSASGNPFISDLTAWDGHIQFDAVIFGDYLYINSSSFGMYRINHDGTFDRLVDPIPFNSSGKALLPTSDDNYLFGVYQTSSGGRIAIYNKTSLSPVSIITLSAFVNDGRYPASWTGFNSGNYVSKPSGQTFGLVRTPAPAIVGSYSDSFVNFNNYDGGPTQTTQRETEGLSAQEFDGKVFWSAVSSYDLSYSRPLSLAVYRSSAIPGPVKEAWLGDDATLLASLSLNPEENSGMVYPLLVRTADPGRLYLFVNTSTTVAYLTSSSGTWSSVPLPPGEYISETTHKIQPANNGKAYFVTTTLVPLRFYDNGFYAPGHGRHRLRSIDSDGNVELVAEIPPLGRLFPVSSSYVDPKRTFVTPMRTAVVMVEKGVTPGVAFLLREFTIVGNTTTVDEYAVGVFFGSGAYQDQLSDAITDLNPLQWLKFEQQGYNGAWRHLDPIRNYGSAGSDAYFWINTSYYAPGSWYAPIMSSIFLNSGYQSFDVSKLVRSTAQIRYPSAGVSYLSGTISINCSVIFLNFTNATDKHFVIWHEGDAASNSTHGVMLGYHTGIDGNTFRFFVRAATTAGGPNISYVDIGPAFTLGIVYNIGATISGNTVTFYINGVTIGSASFSSSTGSTTLGRWFCASNDLFISGQSNFFPPSVKLQNALILNGVESGSSLMPAITWATTLIT